MNCYSIFEEVTSGKPFPISYGIAFTPDTSAPKFSKAIRISDISVDYEKISTLVTLCNQLELSPIHLWDVVEDFLARQCTL